MLADPISGTRRCLARFGRLLGITLISSALLIGAAIPAAAELMRVTFVRHAQSAGNASGLIDTSTPGPTLTQNGEDQARAVVGALGVNNYDGVYASTMQRTQLTATPLSQYLHLPIRVLPGVQEIEAGVFEGTPESEAANGYGRFPLAWALQGNRDLRIPGSINVPVDLIEKNATAIGAGIRAMTADPNRHRHIRLQAKPGLPADIPLEPRRSGIQPVSPSAARPFHGKRSGDGESCPVRRNRDGLGLRHQRGRGNGRNGSPQRQ